MERKKRISVLLLCGALLFLCTGCSRHRTDVHSGEDYIYCINSNSTGIVKVVYEIPEASTEKAAWAVLAELAKPSEKLEYLPAIPETVHVQKCEIEDAIAHVDFSREYVAMQTIDEILCRAAVVQSLLRIDGISGVCFSVDGEGLKNSDGKWIGLMTADDFVQNIGSSPSSYQTDTLTLYFANATGDGLVEEKQVVKYNSNIPKEKLIVQKLMSGPQKSGAYPVLNPDATLLSVTIQEGICYVNFDSEFLNSVYDVAPEVNIYSLVNSLVQGTAAEMVQIMVNGEKNVLYKQQFDLSQPISYEGSWIETVEETENGTEENSTGENQTEENPTGGNTEENTKGENG